MSRTVERVGVPAVAAALALVLLGALVAAALRPGTASAATVLQRGDGVVVQLDDGTSRDLEVGDEVPRGALVVAGRDGAVLRTRDRDTWLGGGSAVTVVDGARQELREGLVMVDARRGPALLLTTAAAAVTTPEGAVSRVERGALLRVGSYDGDPLTVRPAARRSTTPVARDYQVQVPEGGLPGRVTPLVLTAGDPYERALAPELVAADEALGDVADRLDRDGRPAGVVSLAADTDVPTPLVPAGAPVSERSLAYLLARAGDGDVAGRYAEVRALRGDGGSWGVVAAIVSADVGRVAGLLDELLVPGSEAVLVADELDVPALLELVGGAPTASDAPAAGDPVLAAPGSAPRTPGSGGQPAPGQPAPPPPPPPADQVDTLVETVVDTVIGLLPSTEPDEPSTTGTAPAPEPGPAPTLLPLPSLPPLLP